MPSKSRKMIGLVSAVTAKKLSAGKVAAKKAAVADAKAAQAVKENAFPKVLKGGRIEQLSINPKLLAVVRAKQLAGTKVVASNLGQILAGLKARKPTIG